MLKTLKIYCTIYVSSDFMILHLFFRMCEGNNLTKAVELYELAGELREVAGQKCCLLSLKLCIRLHARCVVDGRETP